MISIFLLTCSIVNGAQCKDVELPFHDEYATMFNCMVYSQVELAKWTERNPNWRVARWRCGQTGQFAKI